MSLSMSCAYSLVRFRLCRLPGNVPARQLLDHRHDAPSRSRWSAGARWVLLPFANATETPLASQRAEAVATGLAQSLGLAEIAHYPQNLQDDNLFEAGQGRAQDQALNWAHEQKARYALTGTVQEWRYKVGVDGEPAVGVALQVIDLNDGRIVWSSVGARAGWSRESLAAVAQKLITGMLEPLAKAR